MIDYVKKEPDVAFDSLFFDIPHTGGYDSNRIKKNSVVLDVCGGQRPFHNPRYRTINIDKNRALLKSAASEVGVDVIQCDLENIKYLPFKEKTFDTVVCKSGIADNRLVDEMLRVRKENGEIMLINSGHCGWIEEHIRKKGYKTDLPYPAYFSVSRLEGKDIDKRQSNEVLPDSKTYSGGWGDSFILIK